MIIESISFENYRNLENTKIFPSEGINVICGDNAQGKTNIIECIWLFTGGRSFRGAKDRELVAFGKQYAKTELLFYSYGREQNIDISISENKRSAVLNYVPKSLMSQIIGSFCAVIFSPNHLSLVKSGPELRRNFVDAALCQIKPSYAAILNRYRHTLNSRNILLKDTAVHRELEQMLDIWNERLAIEGARVAVERESYIKKLSGLAGYYYDGISGSREKLEITYKSSCISEDGMDENDIREKIMSELTARQNDDVVSGFTGSGVHRDDLKLRINDKDARSFGSQGQQRSAVLAMKLAEAEILGEEKGEKPVVLLDDVLSELDKGRRDYLLNKLSDLQVFMTCCESVITSSKTFYVRNGVIRT